MRKTICSLASIVLLLASCGPQHEAEAVVEDFMQTYLADPSQLHQLDFSDMDSTRRIGDSIIMSMRQATANSPIYKKGIEYVEGEPNAPLMMLRANYRLGDEEHSSTYYLNHALTGVVAVKTNHAD